MVPTLVCKPRLQFIITEQHELEGLAGGGKPAACLMLLEPKRQAHWEVRIPKKSLPCSPL